MDSESWHRSLWLTRRIFACMLLACPGVIFAAGDFPAEVDTIEFGHGTRLTDTRGLTLYQYENDLREPGTSTCIGECAAKRPPLVATDLSQPAPKNWSLVERNDGALQWAYRGMPLYRYARDSHAGAAYGEGDGWTIAFLPMTTPPAITIAETVLGTVLASASGRTLYFQSGEASSPALGCKSECLETWLPVQAPWGANDYGDFSVSVRDDGIHQWQYRNKPLYSYSNDAATGETNGDGVDTVWRAMILEPALPVPDWIRVVSSDGGALYADANGMTLYTLWEDKNATEQAYRGGNHCDETCLRKYWNPVEAQSKRSPIGHWSVIENEDRTFAVGV